MLKLTKTLLVASTFAVFSLGSVVATADDKIEQQIYQDKNYATVKQKAVQMLQQRGYEVKDIDADDYRMRPALDIEAVKNGQEYDITLSYPDLTILKEKLDNWISR